MAPFAVRRWVAVSPMAGVETLRSWAIIDQERGSVIGWHEDWSEAIAAALRLAVARMKARKRPENKDAL